MANKLKVEELRNELAQRGLTTTGTKPVLVLPLSLFSIGYSFSAGYWFLVCCRFRGSSPLFSKKATNPRTQATVRLVERGEGTPRKMRIQQRLRKSRPLTNSGIWISSNCARKPLFVEFRLLVPKRTCWRGFVKIRTRIQLTFLEVEVWAFTPSKSNFESACCLL